MANGRIRIRLVLAILVVLLTSSSRGVGVFWITSDSQAQPHGWLIEPTAPTDVDVIQFSGPTPTYANACQAEQTLGGRPTLRIYPDRREVQLTFEPPATEDCTDSPEPVFGLKGSFGPLEPGQWRFYSSRFGMQFYREFEVEDVPEPAVYYVDPTATGRNDGSNWANAFTRLQNALAVAGPGCEIRVARGMYQPDWEPLYYAGDRNAAFHVARGVVLKGGYAGRSWPNPNQRDVIAHETVLSGDLERNDALLGSLRHMLTDKSRLDNSYHVVIIEGADSTTVLDGLTITGGVAAGPHDEEKLSCGGGILNENGSPIIRDCLIIGNAAMEHGAGIHNHGRSAPVVADCTITGNWSQWGGGGIYNGWGAELTVTGCIVSGNGVESRGAGLYCHTDGRLNVSNCIISGNTALESTGGRGGALFGLSALMDVTYCTLVGNRAAGGSSLACDTVGGSGGQIVVSSSILWDEGQEVIDCGAVQPEIKYCNVWGGWPGEGNIVADPCFVQMGYWDDGTTPKDADDDTWFDGDYHLLWGSPCLEGGDPMLIPDANATDFDGNPRLSGAVVDMGIYEVYNEPPVVTMGPWVTGFTLDGKSGTLTLDASESYDPEGLTLAYQWYLDGAPVSRDSVFTTTLPLGEHPFELVVSDSAGVPTWVEGVSEILEPVETTATVTPDPITNRRTIAPLTVSALLPEGYRASDFARSEKLLLYPGEIESDRQLAFGWVGGRVRVMGKFDRAKFFEVAPTYGEVPVRMIGRLNDGSFFDGRGTVTLK